MDTERVDVYNISETQFTNQPFVKFRGYKIYHTAHADKDAEDGSAVIIKENIEHYENPNLLHK